MAKAKSDYWLTNEGLILIQGWARDGLTNEQIAQNMGITRQTLNVWSKKYPSISDALKKGKEIVDYAVENALLKNALGGDTTAQIFWLKNRKPKQWRDKPKPEQDVLSAAVSDETLQTLITINKLLEGDIN